MENSVATSPGKSFCLPRSWGQVPKQFPRLQSLRVFLGAEGSHSWSKSLGWVPKRGSSICTAGAGISWSHQTVKLSVFPLMCCPKAVGNLVSEGLCLGHICYLLDLQLRSQTVVQWMSTFILTNIFPKWCFSKVRFDFAELVMNTSSKNV